MWLDTVIRFGPFGLLPEQAANGSEAYLLPEPGRPLVALKTPKQPPVGGREVTLELTLAEDGTLSGDVLEVYRGFEAAQLAETLEGVSNEQRDQALQQALSRYFGGAQLSNLRLDVKRAVGAPVSLRYHFVAPRFARVDDGPDDARTAHLSRPDRAPVRDARNAALAAVHRLHRAEREPRHAAACHPAGTSTTR